MPHTTLLLNARLVNEGQIIETDVLIEGERIARLGGDLASLPADQTLDARGNYLLPGLIDDQVHFREPGLTHKATIYSEARAAVAGGITSFMEMPNTQPPAVTHERLEAKYDRAAQTSLANYSFYLGASNDNLDEVRRVNPAQICGVKVFMGSSTGNMLVDNEKTLENIFREAPTLIATHCEDEATIRANMAAAREKWGEDVPIEEHPNIRSAEACYRSSSRAVALAKQHGARLHILHISTARELELFENTLPLAQKKITAEACLHHLWFHEADYVQKGTLIKWNPAVKTEQDRAAVFQAVLDDRIDVLATDHAPHTREEKNNGYFKAPSGGPLVQHLLPGLLSFWHQGKMSLEKIVEKTSHAPATLFRIQDRGFVREGYFADLVLVDPNAPWTVSHENILYKCGWSPFEGTQFPAKVTHTWVSGHLAYQNGQFDERQMGQRLRFQPR
ncbi:dihydroorotase [Catalinimonas alkaloidigena]|uniref:Dihydroorotase n=1 Tax=Catalinimonas alkaloidigena TaxID=1075417 RepID=A0A1G9DYM6_9BACT|nr:dihydroorotase [Catalinimonas alkaloidigena]SDK68976.1 dihydroorotase [Catalinimonas alkaloidigena]